MKTYRVKWEALSATQEIDKARWQEMEDAEFFRLLKLQGCMGETGQGGKKRRNRKLPAGCFTPLQIAARYGVKVDKVHAWIRAGTLHALNIAAERSSRPRYVITQQALDRFEVDRQIRTPKPTVQRRRKTPDDVIEFY